MKKKKNQRRPDLGSAEKGRAKRAKTSTVKLSELLQELRVMLPGVQVLLAFLLTLPFTNRFDTLTEGERGVYFAAVGLDQPRDRPADDPGYLSDDPVP